MLDNVETVELFAELGVDGVGEAESGQLAAEVDDIFFEHEIDLVFDGLVEFHDRPVVAEIAYGVFQMFFEGGVELLAVQGEVHFVHPFAHDVKALRVFFEHICEFL